MNRTNFYVSVFEGSIEETANYIRENYSGREWDCPTGREDVEGIISVLKSGSDSESVEMDGVGNIRWLGDLETFASIVEEEYEMKKLYYVRTNGYDMAVSVDTEGRVRSITQNNEFPILREDSEEEQARGFLESIEDDSEWEDFGVVDDLDEWMGLNLSHDRSEIIAEIEKDL